MDILNYFFREDAYAPKFDLNTVYSDPRGSAFKTNEDVTMLKEVTVKNLRVFDFDDTLAKVDAKIYVTNGNKKFTLTPAEFAVYNAIPGDMFNFKDFNSVIKSAIPIKKNLNLLKAAAADVKNRVTILTARQLAYPVKHYLKKNFNLDIYIVALGTSDPKAKAMYIEKQIKKGYNNIVFIDDSIKNVYAVRSLAYKYPDIHLETYHTTEAEKL